MSTSAGAQSTPPAQSSGHQSANQTPSSGATYNTQQEGGQPNADTSQDSDEAYYYCSPQMYIEMATYQQVVAANARNAEEAAVARVLVEPGSSKELGSIHSPAAADTSASAASPEVLPPPSLETAAAPKPTDRSGDAAGVPGHRTPDGQTDWLAALDPGLVAPARSDTEIDQVSGESIALVSGESELVAPQPGTLLAGAIPIDVGALERSVGQLFVQFAQPSTEGGWQRAQSLAWWLGAAATATAAFEWARRRVFSPLQLAGVDAEREHAWANDPDLALSPTRDDA